jgi:hypothetical protein
VSLLAAVEAPVTTVVTATLLGTVAGLVSLFTAVKAPFASVTTTGTTFTFRQLQRYVGTPDSGAVHFVDTLHGLVFAVEVDETEASPDADALDLAVLRHCLLDLALRVVAQTTDEYLRDAFVTHWLILLFPVPQKIFSSNIFFGPRTGGKH